MKKIVMISQPMKGLGYNRIIFNRMAAVEYLESCDYTVLDTVLNTDEFKGHKNDAVRCLAESIKFMSNVDAVYFLKGWEEARGCKIEHEIAKQYGIEVLYESEQA